MKPGFPQVTYSVALRTVGGFHKRYGTRFPDIHRGMLHIRRVPNFKWILIHCGEYGRAYQGMPPGGIAGGNGARQYEHHRSAVAYKKFYPQVVDAAEGSDLSITFLDSDR